VKTLECGDSSPLSISREFIAKESDDESPHSKVVFMPTPIAGL